MITVKIIVSNPFQENTLVLSDATGECIIIDAGMYNAQENRALTQYIAEAKLRPVMAVNTHGHVDHMLGVNFVKQTYGIPFALDGRDNFLIESAPTHGAIYGFKVDAVPTVDRDLQGVPTLQFGETTLQIIETPGHTPGHICLYQPEQKLLVTGDTLFRESIGRTDLPGGDYSWIMRSILDKLMPLGDEVHFYPGHGQDSTIGHEALYNPFVTEVMGGEVNYDC
ncbi:MAG: MBL fold metallo-hydrolase [Alistipes sp.]|nr:MBL fold metallo-hydrolase [Alistipes sp.]